MMLKKVLLLMAVLAIFSTAGQVFGQVITLDQTGVKNEDMAQGT